MKILLFIACWLGAGAADFPFLRDFFSPSFDGTSLFLPLLFHTLGAALLLFSSPRGRTYALLTFFLPFIGWLLSLVLFIVGFFPHSEKEAQEKGYHFELEGPSSAQIVPKPLKSYRERVISELDFVPLIDIIKGESDDDLKRGAIEKLSQIKTPEAVDILLSLRSAPSLEIRFYATSAIARIKKEFDEQLEAAKQEMKKDVYKTSARLFLAKIYLRYSKSHLLDEVTTNAYEKEALFHLNTCAVSEYVRDEDFWLLYEVYASQREWDKALEALDRLEKRGKGNLGAIHQARIEIFYLTGQFQKIPEKFLEVLNQGFKDPAWLALAHWWGGYSL